MTLGRSVFTFHSFLLHPFVKSWELRSWPLHHSRRSCATNAMTGSQPFVCIWGPPRWFISYNWTILIGTIEWLLHFVCAHIYIQFIYLFSILMQTFNTHIEVEPKIKFHWDDFSLETCVCRFVNQKLQGVRNRPVATRSFGCSAPNYFCASKFCCAQKNLFKYIIKQKYCFLKMSFAPQPGCGPGSQPGFIWFELKIGAAKPKKVMKSMSFQHNVLNPYSSLFNSSSPVNRQHCWFSIYHELQLQTFSNIKKDWKNCTTLRNARYTCKLLQS